MSHFFKFSFVVYQNLVLVMLEFLILIVSYSDQLPEPFARGLYLVTTVEVLDHADQRHLYHGRMARRAQRL